MIYEILSVYWWVFAIPLEILLLVFFYKFYFAELNAERWLSKARDEEFLLELLDPVIQETIIGASDAVLNGLKAEYTRSQGVLTRLAKGGGEIDPVSMGLKVSEDILKSMGWKNPNVLMVAKLASVLGGMVSQIEEPNSDSPAVLPIGRDLF